MDKSLATIDSELYTKFLQWYVMPVSERKEKGEPENMAEFCAKYKAKLTDLQSFLDIPTFFDDVSNHSIDWAKGKTPRIMHRLYSQIMQNNKDGSVRDIKPEDLREWRNLVYEINKDKEQGAKYIQQNFFNITDEQHRQIIARETKRLASGGQSVPA